MRYALKASEMLAEGDIENFCGIDWDLICQKAHSFFVQFVHFRCACKSKTAYGGFAYILFIILVLVMVMVLVTVDFPMDCPVDYPADARNS